MTKQDDDRAAILAVVEAETDAYLQHDYEAWQSCWHDADEIQRIQTHVGSGVTVTKGPAVRDQMRGIFAQAQTWQLPRRFQRENYSIVIGSDMAWVSYDQIGDAPSIPKDIPGQYHELKILQKVDGAWKISCLVSTQIRTTSTQSPMIEVDGEGRVLEMNTSAQDRLPDHPLLYLKANRIWARGEDALVHLQEAVTWVATIRTRHTPCVGEEAVIRSVPLGQDDAGLAHICWVLLRDGKLLITFDDRERLKTQLNTAGEVYQLSEAQQKLAHHLVAGRDLAAAADAMDISTNTAKTHLQRIYDKTGVRAQPALVRILLSADRRDV
ncbi:DUF4440 domain-containing protein [Tateyamaria omphalii]|uniref:DUF4440 domain-containing protein n=1 Tax=Tateyamaria omphalii TaxID=299262 RepID=UPI001C99B659|nr:DUF4440 domain-containing protein [Tateyamaria omphalii]MBY5931972.1 DUF4440 domain-containing protein [Tateyamaria omphalii]